jgi:hypothetical protein
MRAFLATVWLLSSLALAQQYPPPPYQPTPYQAQPNQYEPPPYQPPQAQYSSDVQRLADHLARSTAYVRDVAAQESFGPEKRENLNALWRFERMAQRFESDVNQYGPDSPAAREDFDRLMRAYGRAANAVEDLRDNPDVYSSFGRTRTLMDRLAPHYGGYNHWGYRYEGNGYRMKGPDLEFGIGGFRFQINH